MIPFRRISLATAAAVIMAASAYAQTGFPFKDESLHYNINWPSGLNLGESTVTATRTAKGWDFSMTLNAAVPAFAVSDKVRSTATAELCSLELDRELAHGSRKTREKTVFDQEKGKATRTTLFPEGGGKSEFDIPSCARDALTYLYYARRELGQGRVPPPQQVFFGGAYSVRMEYTGAVTIPVSEKPPEITDHVVVSVKGQKANFSLEIFFARDAARTPVLVKAPFAIGVFSMEMVR
jgi:hypothetical protein